MDFGQEITQLSLIIVVLGVAYLGITAWVKRGGGFGGGGAAGGGMSGGSMHDLAGDVDDDLNVPSGARDNHPKRSDGTRFDLTGKDAEAAARVLKRMLKQDKNIKKK